jgi:methylase of polypeptide subunit release factors
MAERKRKSKAKKAKRPRGVAYPNVRAVRAHEQAFCADVKSWADALFASRPDLPFSVAGVEQYGPGSHKREDLRIYDAEGKIALTGEVKLPGTPEGRTPFDPELIEDARGKADRIGSRFFFTWNVKELVVWDRQLWEQPALERKRKIWELGKRVEKREDINLPEVRSHIENVFLPKFFSDFAEIHLDRNADWGMPPDEAFIASLNSHLDWPVVLTRDWLAAEADRNRTFSAKLERWMAEDQKWSFARGAENEWRSVLERAARTLCYVLANRMIFYEAVQARFPDALDGLYVPRTTKDPGSVYLRLCKQFQKAVECTGDYQTIFYPPEDDPLGDCVFRAEGAPEAWSGLVRNLEAFNLRTISEDVLGGAFQKLVSPEERHKFGQHFTDSDIVDVINAFCIRKANDTVLDPACGSGSFLVRAYHRKAFLDPAKDHQLLLQEIFGCDIDLFAAHLATLNLAARQIKIEENYPLVARRNFFEVDPGKTFCRIPDADSPGAAKVKMREVLLPPLDAIVGNPPYVRQELIPKESRKGVARELTKEYLADLAATAGPGFKPSGRSDLHVYFWPAACRFLKDGGRFGFLTSSSWLDVDYGFPLQEWVLRNFKLLAVIESVDEPWFEDARVKTCVAVLQRCSDEKERDDNLVRFVRILKPLADVLGEGRAGDENARQRAAEEFREVVMRHRNVHDFHEDGFVRIIAKRQSDLWREGADPKAPERYAGGKWGRYLRAPGFYFDIMKEFGDRFVRLGDIAEIRRGVTSGCDAFFMPHDVTEEWLAEYPNEIAWRASFPRSPCTRREAARGKVKIVRAGDKTVHPIEAKYLAPEVHSPMHIDRPVVRAGDCKRVLLLVGKNKADLKGTHVLRYIRLGERTPFGSGKSDAVSVSQRSTCASRRRWYDLTGHRPGFAFWPMAQQYRHIIAANPERLICNHRLFDIHEDEAVDASSHVAVLNSTLVALWKQFYGRYTGTEGSLDTEVIDVKLIEIPDPRLAEAHVRERLDAAFAALCKRPGLPMVEKEFMSCHSPERAREMADCEIELPEELKQPDRRELDDAVFELLGVTSALRRRDLVSRLHKEVAGFFRQIRIVEIQKQEQRTKTKGKRFSATELAADCWDLLSDDEKAPLVAWLAAFPGRKTEIAIIAGPATLAPAGDLVDALTVYFGRKREAHKDYPHRPMAELVAELSNAGSAERVKLPSSERDCASAVAEFRERLEALEERFEELAASRTGTEKLKDGIVGTLKRWSLHGRE